jgi:thioredoxin
MSFVTSLTTPRPLGLLAWTGAPAPAAELPRLVRWHMADQLRLSAAARQAPTLPPSPPPRPARPVHVADARGFEAEVLRSDVPVLVDFYADWCGPCRALAPTVDRAAANGVKVVKVNADQAQALMQRYQVQGLPTLMVFDRGAMRARQVGGLGPGELEGWVRSAAGR